jgi:hypothetical protein
LTIMAILTFASSGGGGGDKNKNMPSINQFTPIRTTSGFTLKSGPTYRGSQLFTQEKRKDALVFNSVITYKRGNTTFILPYKYKMNLASAKTCTKSNLNVVDVKFSLHR